MRKKIWSLALPAVIVLFGLAQLIPYGRNHTNPPVLAEPNWDSPATRDLAAGACFDCHSNETEWLWYTNIAPFSWVIQNHVDEGRRELNFSEWSGGGDFDELREVINEGEMPPWDYRILHPAARLTPAEKAALVDGLIATVARSGP